MKPIARGGLTLRVLGTGTTLALIVGVSFAVLLRAIFAQRDTARLAVHSQEVLASANRLERLVVDLETGPRGYLLTGQERFLGPWITARVAAPNEAANLRRLAQVPEQRQLAERIDQLVGSYITDYSDPLVAAARSGDAAARGVAKADEGLHRVSSIRAEFDALENAEHVLARQRDVRSAATANQAVVVASTALGSTLVLVVGVTGYLTRLIVRPVRRAAAMADQLAGGDLGTRVPETSVGEIRLLERSFNEMGRSLERGHADLARLVGEQAALRRVATLVAHGETPTSVFTAITEEAGRVLDVDGARMLRQEADGTVTVIASWGAVPPGWQPEPGQRITLADRSVTRQVLASGSTARRVATSAPHGMLVVGAPIVVQGRVWGAMLTMSEHQRPPAPDLEIRLAEFTDLAATAIANSQAREDLTASRARLVAASDETRWRIERDLHDGIQQRLVSIALDLRAVEAGVTDLELRRALSSVAEALADALDELREVARGIHPSILSEGGLGLALSALARRSAIPVDLNHRIGSRPPTAVEIAAYYLVAEALTNATKHARASAVRIDVVDTDGQLEIAISDDGVGGADPTHGSGLVGMTDRIEALGGRITITSPPGAGTRLWVELPTRTG